MNLTPFFGVRPALLGGAELSRVSRSRVYRGQAKQSHGVHLTAVKCEQCHQQIWVGPTAEGMRVLCWKCER